ncbi:N-formylglutamate deformylase [Afifella sp. IM 167]|uniref:N-formylglutamate deformylase n=1 Tax=Afifella sp. IM 167 TaxID=2033586 RepID=UPI001CC90F57|nr:N-formylglutamate deformylase [Afifella sp. IM 167]MBZ8132891.1 N-formylglutamate deformylase [Afifella sp. IM 167]
MSDFVSVGRGSSPLILSMPHSGTAMPAGLESRLVSRERGIEDTDWWIDKLYQPIARDLDASIVHTAMSRTVIDVNRDPSGASLYPGKATTGLVPLETFDGRPLYLSGEEPDPMEIETRREHYFAPYHTALASEIGRVKRRHGFALLYDCHSIRSRVPRLFEGLLPVFNIGSNDGASCTPEVSQAIGDICRASGFETVVNGRFKGGWITRHYGAPEAGVQAVQMEIACRGYMDEDPPAWNANKIERMRTILTEVLSAFLAAAAPAHT